MLLTFWWCSQSLVTKTTKIKGDLKRQCLAMVKKLRLHTPLPLKILFRMVNRICRICGEKSTWQHGKFFTAAVHKLKGDDAISQNRSEKNWIKRIYKAKCIYLVPLWQFYTVKRGLDIQNRLYQEMEQRGLSSIAM